MPLKSFLLLAASNWACSTLTSPAESIGKRAPPGYAPAQVPCPSDPLVRQGNNISSDEAAYVQGRTAKTGPALASWLEKVGFPNATASQMPVIGMSTSGGGFRSMLTGAGVHMAFDEREDTGMLGGLLQGITYESGLSGGGWLVTALAGNNYPTVSILQEFWSQQLANPFPGQLGLVDSDLGQGFVADMAAKSQAGFPATLIDAYGLLLSPLLVAGTDSGVSATWSGFTNLTNFTSFDMPFPIVTSIGVNPYTTNDCTSLPNGTQFEMNPYEFGSWDANVDAFMRMEYLGTKMNNGVPADTSACITGYDRQAYIGGTTGNVWGRNCMTDEIQIPNIDRRTPEEMFNIMAQLWSTATDGPSKSSTAETDERDYYGAYPNPFQGLTSSSLVSDRDELTLQDGAISGQNDPIWPHLHREVNVLLLSDNGGGNTQKPFTSGLSLFNTYTRAQQTNLTRMPQIPSEPSYFVKIYGQKPQFFGCSDKSKMTIISIPNQDYTFNSATRDVYQWRYRPDQVAGMIQNGVAVASVNGSTSWPLCLACAIMDKSPTYGPLPTECNDCFDEYCVGTYTKSDGATATAATETQIEASASADASAAASSTAAASSIHSKHSLIGIGLNQFAAVFTAFMIGVGFFGHLA